MDKTLVFGTKDCRFEPCQGHFLCSCVLRLPQPSPPHLTQAPAPSTLPPPYHRAVKKRLRLFVRNARAPHKADAHCAAWETRTGACSVAVSYKPPMLVTRV